ncbi:protocadherin-15-like [Glandiceps talaboti]
MPDLIYSLITIITLCASLHLIHAQDCFPGPDGVNIHFKILEDFPVGDTIGFLDILGTAGGSNPTIQLQLTSSSSDPCTDYFIIDEDTKAFNLTKPLERDDPGGMPEFSCEVHCTQTSDPFVSFFLEYPVSVFIEDVNDNTPQFVNEPYYVEVSEQTLVSTTVFTGLEATDADSGRNGQVSYFVLNNPDDPDADLYFINNLVALGIVTLNKTLDYETKNEYKVLIEARDRAEVPRTNTTILTVRVIDGDDLGPQFLPCIKINNVCTTNTYTTYIPEKQAITEPLNFTPGPIYAIDQDRDVPVPSQIIYTFIQGTPPQYTDYFEINPTNGNITLKASVDRSSYQLFRIVVKAEEDSHAARYQTANIEIYIDDVNDNKPSFVQSSYSGFVYENSGYGTTVVTMETGATPLQIEAIDPDIDEGVSPELEYRFVGADSRFLPKKVNDILYIVVSGALDRETNTSYSFSVIAMETATIESLESDPVPVTVSILDINDNYPVFASNAQSTDENRYTVRIKDTKAQGSTILMLSASDDDIGDNAVIDFTISYVSNGGSDLFEIEQVDNTVTLILAGATLEPRKEYTVTLKAEDRGPDTNKKSTLAFITIEVIPSASARAPVFTENPYTSPVSESVPSETVIKTVTAIDADGDIVYYNITSGDPLHEFSIGPTSGEVSIVDELDRERQSLYTLTIAATDLNQTVTAELIVTVLDINDNNPIFNSSWPTSFQVDENEANAFVGEVKAYDIDDPNTANAEVEYQLTSDLFAVDPDTGMIYTTQKLDREQRSQYELTITAKDKASSPRSSAATFTVVVVDRNDEGPVFNPSYYQYTVVENTVKTDFLTVQATDNDEAAELEYAITSEDTGLFSVDSVTGSLSILTGLDYEVSKTYTLTVTAVDVTQTNDTIASDDAVVTIHIEDMNDNPPIFTQDVYNGTVLENADLGTIVTNSILATDGDRSETDNGQVIYDIEPSNEFFTISDPQTGIIVTKTSLKRAPKNIYQLTVVAYDKAVPTERLSATATVVIEITEREPIVEEKPEFLRTFYVVNDLKEEEPMNTLVTEVRAESKTGDLIVYDIINGNRNDSFKIESISNVGVIFTNKVLDREESSEFTLTVEASVYNNTNSTSTQRRKRNTGSNIVDVLIELVDINDNPPVFTQSKYIGGVSEDASLFTDVLQVVVMDPDKGINGKTNFSIKAIDGNAKSLEYIGFFQIEAETGLIKTAVKFDSKSDRKFHFLVFAEDNPDGDVSLSTQTEVIISLISNDNRVVLVADVPPNLVEENSEKILDVLEEILNGSVMIEEIGPRENTDKYESFDPSQTDILFYVVKENGDLLDREEILRLLEDNFERLNELFKSFLPGEKPIIKVRPPETNIVTRYYKLETTEAALIALGCILFVLSLIAIIVICYSWKQREAERQRNARLYLPMYNNITAYDSNNASEISHVRMPEPIPNPIFLDDQAVQVDELYPNGEPHFLKAYESQEFTMDFFADASEIGEGEDFTIQVDPEDGVVVPYPDRRLEAITEQSEPSHGSMDRLASMDENNKAEGVVNPALEDSDSEDDIKKPPIDDDEDSNSTVEGGATYANSKDNHENIHNNVDHPDVKVITPNGNLHTNSSNHVSSETPTNPVDATGNNVNHKPRRNIQTFAEREDELSDVVNRTASKNFDFHQHVLDNPWKPGHTLTAQGVTILDETQQDDLREAIMLKNSGVGIWLMDDVQSTPL